MGISDTSIQGGQSPVVKNLILNYDPRDLGFPEFQGDKLFPPLKVDARVGTVEIDNDSFLEETEDTWSDTNGANRVDPGDMTRFTYSCVARSLEVPISDVKVNDREKSGIETAEQYRNRIVLKTYHNFRLQRELRQATKAITAANYDSDCTETIASGSEFDTPNSDVRGVFENAQGATADKGKPATDVLIPLKAWYAIRQDSDMLELLKASDGMIKPEQLFDWLGLRVHIAADFYKNSAGSLVNVWGDNIIFFHMPVVPGPADPGGNVYGRSVQLQQEINDRYREDKIKSWIERIFADEDLIFTAVDNATNKDSIGGYLVKNVLA